MKYLQEEVVWILTSCEYEDKQNVTDRKCDIVMDALNDIALYIYSYIQPKAVQNVLGGNIFSKTNQHTNQYKKGFLVSKTVNSAIRMNGGGGG